MYAHICTYIYIRATEGKKSRYDPWLFMNCNIVCSKLRFSNFPGFCNTFTFEEKIDIIKKENSLSSDFSSS